MRIDVFIGAFINSFVILIVSSKLLELNLKEDKIRFLISFIGISLYISGSYLLTQTFLRTILLFVVIIAGNYFIYYNKNVNFSKVVLVSFISWITAFLSEMLFMILVFGMLQIDIQQATEQILGNFIVNFFISFIFYLIGTNNFYLKFFHKFLNKFEHFKKKYLIIMTMLAVTAFSIMVYLSYFKFNMTITFLLNFIVIMIYMYIIYMLFQEKEKMIKIQNEYELLEKNLDEYEKMYQVQRMTNHEYKNELSVMRGLVNKNNTKLIKYIDEIINLKSKDNNKWMNELKKLPKGGIRGLLFYKMQLMEEQQINVYFEIDRNVSTHMIRKLDDTIVKRLCKVMGIYLDNAIQAVQGLKEKNIQIQIYCVEDTSNMLIVSIMNNFDGVVELDRINERGYSTNGKGRGLGLAIAQDILNVDSNIINTTKIIRNNFMQEIKIKI